MFCHMDRTLQSLYSTTRAFILLTNVCAVKNTGIFNANVFLSIMTKCALIVPGVSRALKKHKGDDKALRGIRSLQFVQGICVWHLLP